MTIPNALAKNALSHDQAINDNYKTDPLVHSKVSLGMGAISLDAAEWLKTGIHEFSIPLLLTHGDADLLTDYTSTKEFSERSKGNITFKTWPGFFHETHNEIGKEEVLQYTLAWINGQLSMNNRQ